MITEQTLRFKLDRASRSAIVETTNAQPYKFWRGNDLKVQLGVFLADAVEDISNLASITFEVDVSQNSALAPVMKKVILAEDFDETLDIASWDDGTKQHAEIDFTATEANVDLGGSKSRTFWMVIHCLTDAGKIVTLGTGSIVCEDDNAGTAGTPDPNDPVYYTKDQADAVMQLRTEKGQADGYAGLDSGGKVPAAQLPAIALTETFEVANEAARLALTSEQAEGKIVVQLDTGVSYGLPTGNDPSDNGDWVALGDRDIQVADVVGLDAALAAKLSDAPSDGTRYARKDGAWVAAGAPFTLNDVADNAAKLALTGIDPGYTVRITGEANRIEKYLGAGDAAFAGVALTGGGVAGVNGIYLPVGIGGGKIRYALSGTDTTIEWLGGKWVVVDLFAGTLYESSDDVDYPWEAVWVVGGDGTGPVPTVERNDIAADDNWLIEGPNTFELLVHNSHYKSTTVNGVSVGSYVTVNVGWVKAAELVDVVFDGAAELYVPPYVAAIDGVFMEPVDSSTDANWGVMFHLWNLLSGAEKFAITVPVKSRGTITVKFSD